jgi:hypothetical protein
VAVRLLQHAHGVLAPGPSGTRPHAPMTGRSFSHNSVSTPSSHPSADHCSATRYPYAIGAAILRGPRQAPRQTYPRAFNAREPMAARTQRFQEDVDRGDAKRKAGVAQTDALQAAAFHVVLVDGSTGAPSLDTPTTRRTARPGASVETDSLCVVRCLRVAVASPSSWQLSVLSPTFMCA